IIVPFIILTAGTGAVLSMIFAAIIGVVMAFCWAELSAAFPVAGGDYALVWHAFRGRWGQLGSGLSFVTFALMLSSVAFIPAVIALGTAEYLSSVVTLDTAVAGAVVCLIAAIVGILRIRTNAVLTGIFLAIELIALLILTILGLVNMHVDRIGDFFSGVIGNSSGGLDAVPLAVVFTATASAVFAYNGYSNAVNFSEETQGSSRHIATAILWSLVITVIAELVPTMAVLLGAPDLAAITTSSTPMIDFMKATSNDTINNLVSLGVALAIFNATLAIILEFGRILYSSARDRAWPGVINDWLSSVHPSFRTPWVATALVGIVSAILCLTVDLNTLITLTGASLVADYALISLAGLVGRQGGATANSPYRMPWWPLPPLVALIALVYIVTQQTSTALLVTGGTILIGFVYWLVVIYPQRGRAWNLKEPLRDETA
ncbi:MAG TPA: APC family permease, partial [Candidatus Limnocylindrales bacterium]|nr:APC family permease [Candidatus Limnocylindrales bacterium]